MSCETWHRVSRQRRCAVCGKVDWCTFTDRVACCMRVQSDRPLRNGGWLHQTSAEPWPPDRRPHRVRLSAPQAVPSRHFDELARRFQQAMNAPTLDRLSHQLGVGGDALRRLRVGWSPEYGGSYSFPMCGSDQKVCGIKLRLRSGRKISLAGGREGLFLPRDLTTAGPLFIAEGPTDTAALLTLGFAAVGRPSCTGGVRLVRDFARGRHAVVVADGDQPGQRGAATLARVLAIYCPSIRTIRPPAGIKDAREWLRHGATAVDVLAAVERAEPLRVRVRAVLNWRGSA